MTSYVKVELPKCSVCLEGFGAEETPVSHRGGEQHPLHWECLRNLINAGNQVHPIYGVQKIKCPVCKIELPSEFPPNPIQNPAPSVRAASNELSSSSDSSENSDSFGFEEPELELRVPEQYFDRLSRERQIEMITEGFNNGLMDRASYDAYLADLQNS